MEEGGSALLRVPGVRHKKQDGTLHLTSSEIGWSEESSGLVQISFPYHLIKCTYSDHTYTEIMYTVYVGYTTLINLNFRPPSFEIWLKEREREREGGGRGTK